MDIRKGKITMQTHIFHTVNSGLYFCKNADDLLVDGIHQGEAVGFSPMASELKQQLQKNGLFFTKIHHLLFTHTHKDHFDADFVSDFLKNAHPQIYSPDPHFANITPKHLPQNADYFQMGNFRIYTLQTRHDCAQFKDLTHYSYYIQLDEESFFIAGDAVLSQNDFDTLSSLHLTCPDAAFVNLYQIADPLSQEFLRQLKPKRVFLYHLPFPQDDVFQIYTSMKSALKKYPSDLPPAEQLSHMSWVDHHAPSWVKF